MKKISLFLLFQLFWVLTSHSQKLMKKDINPIKKYIQVLSHDSLEGRGTATVAEKKSAEYIINIMKQNGLKSYTQYSNFIHPFNYTSAKYSENSKFKMVFQNEEKIYRPNVEYWPISLSSSGRAFSGWYRPGFGIIAPELKQNDYENFTALDSGKVFIINIQNPDGINPHSYFSKYDLAYRAQEASKHGASAVVFYKTDAKVEDPDTTLSVKVTGLGIPVIYTNVKNICLNRIQKNAAFFIENNIVKLEQTGHNVIGTLDYGNLYTIVIGAHYDHLGKGEQGGSLHVAHSKEIHNGADDNASGVALMLDLIKTIASDSSLHLYNYMFVAFSGEELGLYGSANLLKNLPINVSRINCMINMDMVGRLDTVKKTLAISGTGTSPQFTFLDSIYINGLQIKKSESGIGPSDHASFYKENIPVLHFFTGMHQDYHKPSDDEKYINYDGIYMVKNYIQNVLSKLNQREKLYFSKTKDSESTNAPKYKVSLVIMPDYIYEGQGVRADGVTEGKPAFAAGIKKGDIIIKLGDFTTADMGGYTKALSNFNKGDKTDIIIIRAGKELKISVVF